MELLSETVVCQPVSGQVLLTSRQSLQRRVMKQAAAGINAKIPEFMQLSLAFRYIAPLP